MRKEITTSKYCIFNCHFKACENKLQRMKRPFREHHLLTLIEEYEGQTIPLDLAINRYFRAHSALGSKDRGWIAETVYGMVRWKGLLDALLKKPITWEKRLALFADFDPEAHKNREDLPKHVRCSFPFKLFARITGSHGIQKGFDLCWASNVAAPTFVRVNPLKTTREALLKKWHEDYDVSPCKHSPLGIIFHKKMNFFTLPEFKEGFFEVQDEGSQLLASLVGVKPGEQVLDYCAGSGGKSLAFAPQMEGRGQVFLHDVRSRVLQEARKRLKRAGIQNGQVVEADSPNLKRLKKKMDWVLVDVPCSGTGTLRRNPDMKWKFSEEMLQRLLGQQRSIFEKALSFLKPGGHIVYGTCSLLNEENQDQMEHFLKTYPLKRAAPPFQSLPAVGEMDGFFGVDFIYNP